jgi:hypothetical protein
MSWDEHHSASQTYAIQADFAARGRNDQSATELYRKAAEEEVVAISELEPGKARTLAVTVVSAASLWFKSNDFGNAERFVCKWLASDQLTQFASYQLKTILQSVWNERTLRESGIQFAGGEILVRVTGGEILHGGAPLDLVSLKVDEVRNFFYRTVELLLNRPLRRRGMPSLDVREQFRPWLLQAPAGSYQFAVRIQRPIQSSLFPLDGPQPEEVSQKVLEIIDGTVQEKSDVLEKNVPDAGYREVFLELARNLAPTGKTFGSLEMRPGSDMDAHPVLLTPEARKFVNTTIRQNKKADTGVDEARPEEVVGTLRALNLDKDWIEIAQPSGQHVQVHDAGDVIDDIVGPLVNHTVVVDAVRQPDGKLVFRDIQPYE